MENGTNNHTKEEAIIFFWCEYVFECVERHDVTLEEILKFVSGSGKIPAIGFETTPKVKFTGSDRVSNVSTCDMLIMFPTGMGCLQYQEFREKMDVCIQGSYGFGGV